jgi:alkaline phosphatase D
MNSPTMNRRQFLRATAVATAVLPVLLSQPAMASDTGESPFVHGVASGDPLADRVIL